MLSLILAFFAALGPAGSRQARVDIDITGDGRREVFIARDYQGFTTGDDFEVFSPEPGGKMRPLGRLSFNLAMGFRVDAAHQRLVVLSPSRVGEAIRIEYSIGAGFTRLGEARLAQEGASRARYDREFQELESFWAGARPLQAYADTTDGQGLPIWKDVDTGTPIKGLPEITPPTSTPPVPDRAIPVAPSTAVKAKDLSRAASKTQPALAAHFLSGGGSRGAGEASGDSVWLIGLDVTGDGVAETLLGRSGNSARGFSVYTPSGEGYRFLGKVPIQPLTFRYDPKEKLLIDENRDRPGTFEAFMVTDTSVRRVRRTGLPENPAWATAQREVARRFRESSGASILETPLARFVLDPGRTAWRSLVTGAAAFPSTQFERPVLNPQMR